MSPTLRSRTRYPEDSSNRSLRNRLNLLIIFFAAQVILTVIIWLDVSALKEKIHDETRQDDPITTNKVIEEEPLMTSRTDEVRPDAVLRDKPEDEPIDTMEPKPIVIQVLNGCGVGGIAGKVSKWLEKNSYKVEDIDNADRQDYKNSHIIDRSGNMTAARELATLLGIDESRIKRLKLMPKPEIDLTLILGKDHKRLAIGR